MKYVALLRGINVGGKKKVPMEELKKQFLNYQFRNVSTLLNTGNVFFESDKDLDSIIPDIQSLLKANYPDNIPFEVLKGSDMIEFFENESIQKSVVNLIDDEKLIFTFINNLEKKVVHELSNVDYLEVIDYTDNILCIKYSLKNGGTPVLMKQLDKSLNKNGTSRNYNTVKKITERLKKQ